MINNCLFKGQYLEFHNFDMDDDANIFTLVVGKNGVGKSLLLQKLICSFLPAEERVRDRDMLSSLGDMVVFNESVKYSRYPSKIIASSTSPFDKFPHYRKKNCESIYEYLGLKGLSSSNLSLGFMGRTIGSLIRAVDGNYSHLKNVLTVFDYLDFVPYLKARMVLDLPPHRIRDILGAADPHQESVSQMSRRPGAMFFSGRDQGFRLKKDQLSEVLHALEYFINTKSKPRVDIVIDQDGVYDGDTLAKIGSIFTVLLEAGLLRIRDVSLQKKGVDNVFKISEASSGEQCVLMALLGVASHIEDNSLVFIDEPEICLHPEWQEKYIELLIESFKGFRGCHFIVATHSPQVVSNLASNNCYVLDMQRGETVNAREVNKKSADFQLASTFRTPGFRNEYMSREFVSALSALSVGEVLSKGRLENLYKFMDLKSAMDEDDPVYKLIEILSKALED